VQKWFDHAFGRMRKTGQPEDGALGKLKPEEIVPSFREFASEIAMGMYRTDESYTAFGRASPPNFTAADYQTVFLLNIEK